MINYAALKTKAWVGSQLGGTLACFSTFKLLGPEAGIGCIIGEVRYIEVNYEVKNYSGGGQGYSEGLKSIGCS